MINVVIKENSKKEPYSFSIRGHAMYDEYGKDIICAGVSVLAITIANSMLINCKNEVNVLQDEKNATITIKIPNILKGNASDEVKVLSKTLLLGLTNIEKEYGNKYINVKEEVTND